MSCIFSFDENFFEFGCQPVLICDIMSEALPVIPMTAVYTGACICSSGRQKGEYTMSKLWNEDTLREGLFRHDEAALEEVSRLYGRLLYGLAYRILGSAPDAEECVNDALFDLWNAVPPDRPKGILAYVSALVRRRAVDRVRYKTASRRGGEDYKGSLDELSECLSDPDGESALETIAIRDCLQRFLRTLSEEDRIIFTLRYFSCMPSEEIGEACGLRGSAVVMRLVRIRKKLKRALERDGIYI